MIIFRSDGVSDTDILLSLMGDKLNEMLLSGKRCIPWTEIGY
jgi:hypothetical protein